MSNLSDVADPNIDIFDATGIITPIFNHQRAPPTRFQARPNGLTPKLKKCSHVASGSRCLKMAYRETDKCGYHSQEFDIETAVGKDFLESYNTECPICLDAFTDDRDGVHRSPCKHGCHLECMKGMNKLECPACRAAVTNLPEDVVKIIDGNAAQHRRTGESDNFRDLLSTLRAEGLSANDNGNRFMQGFGAIIQNLLSSPGRNVIHANRLYTLGTLGTPGTLGTLGEDSGSDEGDYDEIADEGQNSGEEESYDTDEYEELIPVPLQGENFRRLVPNNDVMGEMVRRLLPAAMQTFIQVMGNHENR